MDEKIEEKLLNAEQMIELMITMMNFGIPYIYKFIAVIEMMLIFIYIYILNSHHPKQRKQYIYLKKGNIFTV